MLFTPLSASLHSTRVATKINGHGDKRSSEIITPKTFKGVSNDITQTGCQDKHCLNIFCHLVCAILLFTPLRRESLKTVYLYDRLSL